MTERTATIFADLERAWAGDADLLVSLYDRECVFTDKALGLVHHGHDGIREVFAFTFSMMPDFRVAYADRVLGADAGAATWTFTGSFHGEFGGRRYQGVPVRIEGVSFMTFADGRIRANADYWNLSALADQLAASGVGEPTIFSA